MKAPALDPSRAALAVALGHVAAAGKALAQAPDASGLREALKAISRQLSATLDALPVQAGLRLEEPAREVWSSQQRAELEWRVADTWKRHLAAYSDFKREHSGAKLNGSGPLPDAVRKLIRDAILEYDKELLAPEDRERWRKESRARAAGVGIFFSPWHTGVFPDLPVGERPRDWSGPYLSHDIPWRKKNAAVSKFAQLYFEERARRESEI